MQTPRCASSTAPSTGEYKHVPTDWEKLIRSYTIPQFCAAYHFSRVYYYTLKTQGKAPQELRIGRRVVITRKCAEEWEARMLAEQQAAAIAAPVIA